MATLTTPLFGRVDDSSEDEEQLLKLFWNRAELKKELDKLRRDSVLAAEKLKRQEGITLRVQQQLVELEAQLADPDTAPGVVTYYQLQSVWATCRNRLLAVSKEMERVHYDNHYRQHVAAFRDSLNKSLVGAQQMLQEVNHSGETLSKEIHLLREQRSMSNGIWNFFRRRQLTAEIQAKRIERRAITMRLGELTEEIQARSGQSPPEFKGLDTKVKRAINLKVLASAQELYLYFIDHDIARLAREAVIRALGDLQIGSRRDCRVLSAHIEEQQNRLAADSGFPLRVQMRMQHLWSDLKYRCDTDTVPMAGTLGSIALLNETGEQLGAVATNILGDEYWDIFAALLT